MSTATIEEIELRAPVVNLPLTDDDLNELIHKPGGKDILRLLTLAAAPKAPENVDQPKVRPTNVEDVAQRTREYRAWDFRPMSARNPRSEGSEWLWHGFLMPGKITMLAGPSFAGKTTMITELLRRLGDKEASEYLGLALGTCKFILVTEEDEDDWEHRDSLKPIGDHGLRVSCPQIRDMKEWMHRCSELAEKVREEGIGLVIFDALPSIWPMRDENDAAQVNAGLRPLRDITKAGAAVLFTVHTTRDNDRYRGSGAYAAFADILLDFRFHQGDDDPRRILKNKSRRSETQKELALEYQEGVGYSYIGSKATIESRDRQAIIREHYLPLGKENASTAAEILERWDQARDGIKPGEKTLKNDLDGMYKAETAQRIGGGVKGSAFRYYLEQG